MKVHFKRLNQSGFDHIVVAVVFVALFAVVGVAALLYTHAADLPQYNFKLALDPSYCLDNLGNSSGPSKVYMYPCNDGGKIDPGEEWQLYGTDSRFLLQSPHNTCVSGVNGVGSPGNRKYLVTQACNSGNELQLWHESNGELVNNDNHGCINDPGNGTSTTQLILYPCGSGPSSNYEWEQVTVDTTPPSCPAGDTGTYPNCKAPTGGGGGGGGTVGCPGEIDYDNSCLPYLNLSAYNSSTSFSSNFCGILRSYYEDSLGADANPGALSILGLNTITAQTRFPNCFNYNGKTL